MKLYHFDWQGDYIGQTAARLDQEETKKKGIPVYLVPSGSTLVAVPTVPQYQRAWWTGASWELKNSRTIHLSTTKKIDCVGWHDQIKANFATGVATDCDTPWHVTGAKNITLYVESTAANRTTAANMLTAHDHDQIVADRVEDKKDITKADKLLKACMLVVADLHSLTPAEIKNLVKTKYNSL